MTWPVDEHVAVRRRGCATRNVASNTLAMPADPARVAERGAPRRPVDEDRRQLVGVVVAPDGLIEDDALAAEHRDRLRHRSGRRPTRPSRTGSACRRPGRAGPGSRPCRRRTRTRRDRSTVATPFLMVRPRSRVPSGIVGVHRRPGARAPRRSGPRAGRSSPPWPTAWVFGTSRRTGTRPALSGEAAEEEVGAHDRRVGGIGGRGRGVRRGRRRRWGRRGRCRGPEELGRLARTTGRASASSDGTSTDGAPVGSGVAGEPSAPVAGLHAAARTATQARATSERRPGQVDHEVGPRGGLRYPGRLGAERVDGHRPTGNGSVTGSVEREDQPAARPVLARSDAAEQRRVLGGDGQPEAGAAAVRDGSAL